MDRVTRTEAGREEETGRRRKSGTGSAARPAGGEILRLRGFPFFCVTIYGVAAALSLYGIFAGRSAKLSLSGVLGYGLSFSLNPLSLLFAAVSSVAWFLSGLFSLSYFASHGTGSLRSRGEHDTEGTEGDGAAKGVSGHGSPAAFHAAFLLSFLFTVAVFTSGDYLTMFLSFELLTLSSYLLVRHEGTAEAERAGALYLYMSVAGGLLILAGILILSWHTGRFDFSGVALLPDGARTPVLALLIAGFGIKAGLPGLNVWLPEAHPVAPSPASAVLSGVMVKVGAYGIITALAPAGEFLPRRDVFLILAFLGVVNIWWGGLRALGEDNLKRVLAFSSVSQMGYILVAVGAAGILGGHNQEGIHASLAPVGVSGAGEGISAAPALAMSGALYHILAHSMFKACLFLLAGAFLMSRGSLSLKDLRGAAKSYSPWIPLGTAAGVLALTGLPGTAGFVSKTLIHESLIEAVHESVPGAGAALILEKGFLWGSYLTAIYVGKVLLHLYAGTTAHRVREKDRSHNPVLATVFASYALLLVLAGTLPVSVLGKVVGPAAGCLTPVFEDWTAVHLFTPATVSPVVTGYVVAAAVLVSVARLREHRSAKAGTLLTLYQRGMPRTGAALVRWGLKANDFTTATYTTLAGAAQELVRVFNDIERITGRAWTWSSRMSASIVKATRTADEVAGRAFQMVGRLFSTVTADTKHLDAADDRLFTSVASRSFGSLVGWVAAEELALQSSVGRTASQAIRLPLTVKKVDDTLNQEARAVARNAATLVKSSSRFVEAPRPRTVQDWVDRSGQTALAQASRILIWLTLGTVVLAGGALLALR